MSQETPAADSLFSRICETSARPMGGTVQRSTIRSLQKEVRSQAKGYPWQSVVDRILAEPVDQEKMVQQALRSQRDWVVRGGRKTPGKGAKHHAKSFVAKLLARLIFMAIFIPVVVVLLVLMRHQWPWCDIYRILDWLAEVWPAVFGR